MFLGSYGELQAAPSYRTVELLYDKRRSEVVAGGKVHCRCLLYTSNQCGSQETLDVYNLQMADLVRIMRTAFTGDASGSNKKVFVAGSALIEAINNLEYTRVVGASQTTTRWGIDFQELRSKFGTLYVVHGEIFDQCGLEECGIIIDPEYMTKYVHVPFKVDVYKRQ